MNWTSYFIRLIFTGEGKLGTDESTFNKIMAKNSQFQLMYIFYEYEKLHEHSFEETLDNELSGALLDGYKAICEYENC